MTTETLTYLLNILILLDDEMLLAVPLSVIRKEQVQSEVTVGEEGMVSVNTLSESNCTGYVALLPWSAKV